MKILPAGVSRTKPAHSALLRSNNPRADQCRIGTSVTAIAAAEFNAVMPVERLGADRAVGAAHGDIVAERRNHAGRKPCGELRQRCQIEMIVVAVRHQRDVDGRKRVEGDSGVVVTLRPGPADRRGAFRPHRVNQNVKPRCLNEPAGVADERQPHLVAAHALRRRVRVRARRPFGPGLPLSVTAELPAQQLAKRFRRHAVGIEKLPAVEMIGRQAHRRFSCCSSRPMARRWRRRRRRTAQARDGG